MPAGGRLGQHRLAGRTWCQRRSRQRRGECGRVCASAGRDADGDGDRDRCRCGRPASPGDDRTPWPTPRPARGLAARGRPGGRGRIGPLVTGFPAGRAGDGSRHGVFEMLTRRTPAARTCDISSVPRLRHLRRTVRAPVGRPRPQHSRPPPATTERGACRHRGSTGPGPVRGTAGSARKVGQEGPGARLLTLMAASVDLAATSLWVVLTPLADSRAAGDLRTFIQISGDCLHSL